MAVMQLMEFPISCAQVSVLIKSQTTPFQHLTQWVTMTKFTQSQSKPRETGLYNMLTPLHCIQLFQFCVHSSLTCCKYKSSQLKATIFLQVACSHAHTHAHTQTHTPVRLIWGLDNPRALSTPSWGCLCPKRYPIPFIVHYSIGPWFTHTLFSL
jgi:hypothetical protein